MALRSTAVRSFPTHEARFRLDGRTVFLSGAAGHLGRAMAIGFVQAGAHVILNGRTEATLRDFADELAAAGFSASVAAFDVGDRASADAFLSGLDRLDVLVNNAIGGLGVTRESSAEQFRETLTTGLVACHENILKALPALEAAVAATGQASVINITSIWGHVSPPMFLYEDNDTRSPPQYGAAKGGLLQLTRYLACQLAPKRIRVNSLSPGVFPGDEVAAIDPPLLRRFANTPPMRRLGLAPEITGPAVFLASDASSYMTGTDLKVDGGWTAW
jgi:NAD(P)-dependent dehydrogenase (short-subunit alcohol dehydrogenase family)